VAIEITGRHIEVTDALKSYVEKKLEKINKYFDRVHDVHVVLTVEKHRHIAEITIHANNIVLHGEEESEDMYASIDKLMDKLENQMRKYRDKFKPHHTKGQSGSFRVRYNVVASESEKETPQVVRVKQFEMKPMSLEEAIMQLDLLDQEFLMFKNVDTGQINLLYRRKDGNYGLIEPEE